MRVVVCLAAAAIIVCLSSLSVKAQTFTISGKITEPPSVTGVPISGVTVTLTINGGTQTMTQTDGTGSFSFLNIPAGSNYEVVPGKPSFVFQPTTQSGTNLSSNETLFFTGSANTATNSIQFSAGAVSVGEGAGSLTIAVTRTGDTSASATVDYQTSDTAGTQGCNVTNNAASSRCDYITKLGTLRFAAGETTKNISVPVIDDVRAEGAEAFSLVLTNPIGAVLGGPSIASITITENDSVNGTQNPINDATFFVRQHYLDFLNREPDAGGLAFWTNEITSCGSNSQCIEIKRINVSAAFFLSIEFQDTGYFVYRIYKSAFGNLPGAPVPVSFLSFLRDTQRIGDGVQVGIGDWAARLDANKQAFSLETVLRSDFKSAFPNSLTASEFVDQLNANAGGVLSAQEKTDLIGMLTSPAEVTQRANVLRAIAEDQDLKNAEFNKAFVSMQYIGYLRRNPNAAPDTNFDGWQFWLNKLNQFNGNFIDAEMVKAFIISIEYGQRFAP